MPTIYPVDQRWIQTYLLEPYSEGSKRIFEAWKGATSDDYCPTPLSLKTRTVYLLSGSLLMLPLVNSVIWIFWKTFGDPTSAPPVPERPSTPRKIAAVNGETVPAKAPDFYLIKGRF